MMITTMNPNGSSRTGPYDDDNDLTIAFAHGLIITSASNGQPAFLIVTNIYIFFSFTFSRLSSFLFIELIVTNIYIFFSFTFSRLS